MPYIDVETRRSVKTFFHNAVEVNIALWCHSHCNVLIDNVNNKVSCMMISKQVIYIRVVNEIYDSGDDILPISIPISIMGNSTCALPTEPNLTKSEPRANLLGSLGRTQSRPSIRSQVRYCVTALSINVVVNWLDNGVEELSITYLFLNHPGSIWYL
jgi:hypothetical protein